MSLQTLNEYKGLYSDGTSKLVVSASLAVAATNLTDPVTHKEPSLLQCIQAGISVLVPSALVQFKTEVSPAEALAANCIATPTSYTVEDGTEVIFSAIPTVGWVFSHWMRDGAILNDTAVPPVPLPATAKIAVPVGTPDNVFVTYTAVFTASV
jgi:hypothetical protein